VIDSLREAGDVVECNGTPWLKLMEVLGYVGVEDVQVVKTGVDVREYLFLILRHNTVLAPVIRKFTVLRDIPEHMM
jgi:hypothetical protein